MGEVEVFMNRLKAVVDCHRGTISNAEVLGCLEMMKAELLAVMLTDDSETVG